MVADLFAPPQVSSFLSAGHELKVRWSCATTRASAGHRGAFVNRGMMPSIAAHERAGSGILTVFNQ